MSGKYGYRPVHMQNYLNEKKIKSSLELKEHIGKLYKNLNILDDDEEEVRYRSFICLLENSLEEMERDETRFRILNLCKYSNF